MLVRYHCHYGKLTGYGRAARDYCAAIVQAGDVTLEIVAYDDVAQRSSAPRATSPEARYAHLDRLVRTPDELAPADVEVHHTLPRHLAALSVDQIPTPGARRAVAMTTWETDTLPEEYAQGLRPLRGFDEVIVPSEFCWRALSRANVDALVVPHCFDPQFWTPKLDAVRARGELGPTRFYTIGAWGERKNPLGVLRAYLNAFTAADNVQLLMLMTDPDFDAIRSLVARCGLPAGELPEIHIPDQAFTEQQLLELHAGADCYVSATRAEGWGLGHFEAAIMANWIITPTHGGHVDFLRHGFGVDAGYPRLLSVRYHQTPCFGSEVKGPVVERNGQRMQTSRVAMPPGVTCKHLWAEPDLGAIAHRMRELHDDRISDTLDTCDDETLAARASLEERYSYNTIGRYLADTLKEICSC